MHPDEHVARRLAQHAEVATAPAGTVLARAGAIADDLLLIVSGLVDASDSAATPGRRFLAGTGDPPVFPHTWRARTDVKFARLAVATVEREAAGHSIDSIASAILEVLHRRDLLAGAAAMFGSLDAAAIADLETDAEWIALERGGVLMRQGDEGDLAFVLLAGRLQAVHEAEDGITSIVGDIAVGETVGDMSLFTDNRRRSATVRAVRDSLLIGLPRSAMERLLGSRPGAVRHLMKVQIERVQRANEGSRGRAPFTNIVVVPLDADVEASGFCPRLSAELAVFGHVEHLDADTLDARLGRSGAADSGVDDPDASVVTKWLNDVERTARFVVHETSARHRGWLARSARRADVVILVGSGKADPAVTDVERQLAREEGDHPAHRFLVLLHDGHVLPSATSAWLAARSIARHLHVRPSRPGDIGRVARFIAGRAVGLVLGAGGARGFAHIGVLRTLQEQRVPVDMVGGTSMGAAMSAQYAMDWTPQRIVETADEIWNRMRPHKEYTFPLLSVLRGRRARRCAEMMYGDVRIEDLWVPYFCVSSDLTDAAMFVHRSGPLLDAVTASSSPPVISVPTPWNDHLLCDGSLFNTLPVDLARDSGCGTVIASRVSVPQDKEFVFDRVPTLAQVLRHKMTRRPIRYPDVMSVLLRSSMIAAVDRENHESRHADLLFVPPVAQYGLMEFGALREVVDVGYAFAKKQFEEWRLAGRLAILPPLSAA